MKNSSKESYAKLGLIALGLLVFLVTACGALGIVWMRQQITDSAQQSVMFEKSLTVVLRRNSALQSQIAQMHNPGFLRAQVVKRMAIPSGEKVVWMGPVLSQPGVQVAKKAVESAIISAPVAMAFNQPMFHKLLP